ncbi:MAG: DUF427 domain-containing protein [Pseudomonadota bacterium]
MDTTTQLTIAPAGGTWVVRAAGAVIGESTRALELHEAGHSPVIYFPREDIEMAFLDPTDHSTHCPRKGDASYFSIVAKSGAIPNAVWSYEDPVPAAAGIAGYLAFYATEKVTVERL